MENVKILIAEDKDDERKDLVKELRSISSFNFDIKEADTADKAIDLINRSEVDHFDILFADIDFTSKGGETSDGYKIIRRAFDKWSLTQICICSNQNKTPNNIEDNDRLRGLIVLEFDKNCLDPNDEKSFKIRVLKLCKKIVEQQYLKDIWKNHNLILNLLSHDYPELSDEVKISIRLNLEFINNLLRNINTFPTKEILFNLIIHLYHQSLELFCKSNQDENTIKQNAKENKYILGKYAEKLECDKITALTIIASHSKTQLFEFGSKLNFYRNFSIHKNKIFSPVIHNIMFANLCLTLYIAPKQEDIQYSRIESHVFSSPSAGESDLKEILIALRKK